MNSLNPWLALVNPTLLTLVIVALVGRVWYLLEKSISKSEERAKKSEERAEIAHIKLEAGSNTHILLLQKFHEDMTKMALDRREDNLEIGRQLKQIGETFRRAIYKKEKEEEERENQKL